MRKRFIVEPHWGIASLDNRDTMKVFICILAVTAAFAGVWGAPSRAPPKLYDLQCRRPAHSPGNLP